MCVLCLMPPVDDEMHFGTFNSGDLSWTSKKLMVGPTADDVAAATKPMPPVAKPAMTKPATKPKPVIRKAASAERLMVKQLVREHNAVVAEFNSTMQRCIAKHEEILEQQEVDHRDDIAFLEQLVSFLCQGAPQKAANVKKKVRARGLSLQLRTKRPKLEAPPALQRMNEVAFEAVEEVVEVSASPPPTKSKISWK